MGLGTVREMKNPLGSRDRPDAWRNHQNWWLAAPALAV
jgi:hypothetical protein